MENSEETQSEERIPLTPEQARELDRVLAAARRFKVGLSALNDSMALKLQYLTQLQQKNAMQNATEQEKPPAPS